MQTTELDAATVANLRTLSAMTGHSGPDLIREAVAAYLEDIRAAEESLRELAAGAKPLSLEELDEYLTRGVER